MRIESRHQLVLDLTRQDVRDYIVSVITDALQRGNVDYVKWEHEPQYQHVGLLPAES